MILVGEERNVRAPKELHKLITATGGRNPHGEPRYRLVWGWERKEWRALPTKYVWNPIEKVNQGRDVVVQYVPKYRKCDRFYLEFWVPPDKYGGSKQWANDTHRVIDGQIVETLGPYPAWGEYEYLWECSDVDGSFIHPTENMMLRAIRQHQHALNMDRARRRAEAQAHDDAQEAALDSEKRTATRELAKEFVEKSLPGRTVQQLKEELTAPKERKRWRATSR